MSNNSSYPCDMPPLFWAVRDDLYIFAYYVLPPVQLVAGLFGHVISFLAFYKESRKAQAYTYQYYMVGWDGLSIPVNMIFYMTFRWWPGFTAPGAFWYTSNYALMWYSAHVAVPLLNVFLVIVLILSVFMAADRFVAIAQPHAYAKADHKKYQSIAMAISVVVGFSTSAFDCFRYYLIRDGELGAYKIITDEAYMGKMSTTILLHLRNFVQGSGVLALVVLNVGAIRAFRNLSRQQTGIMNDKRLADRKKAETTLLLLSFTQCVFMIVERTFLVGYYITVFSRPSFLQCGARVAGPLLEIVLQIPVIANFYVALCISKPFRLLIKKQLSKEKWNATIGTTSVQMITVT